MKLSDLFEIASPYQKTYIDPALLTFDEYIKMVNSQNKWHDDNAYNRGDYDKIDYIHKEEYTNLINNKTINGILFEIREKRFIPSKPRKYPKYLPNGQIFQINNEIQYYSPEEVAKMNLNNHYSEYAIFVNNDCVAFLSDEFGAYLVKVAKKYRSFGLGQILQSLIKKSRPDWDSGGFTDSGYNLTIKSYRKWVKEYLANGTYSYLIKNNILTKEKVKEILNSAKLKDYKKPSSIDLNFNNEKDWLVYADESKTFFIVYSKQLQMYYNDEKYQDFIENAIVGFAFYRKSSYGFNYFYTLNAKNSKVYNLLSHMVINYAEQPFYITKEQYNKISDKSFYNFGKVKTHEVDGWFKSINVKEKINYNSLFSKDINFRKTFDHYGEFTDRLHELAEIKYNQ